MVLNAVANRIRSVSTAKISPTIVTTIGATMTQMRLFLIALRVAGVAEHRRVVVQSDPARAVGVAEAEPDRLHDRPGDEHRQHDQRGGEERETDDACLPAGALPARGGAGNADRSGGSVVAIIATV